jgi:Putative transmembrane protein (PGPGW)
LIVRAKAKELWKTFEKAPPGERFVRLRRAQNEIGGWTGIALALLGAVLVAAGVVFLFVPGPGTVLIAFGAALLAPRSLWLANRLDDLEVLLRRLALKAVRFWRSASIPVRAAVILAGTTIAAGAAYASYAFFLK